MYLRLTPNLLHFLPDLGAFYALRRAPDFYKIHPWLEWLINLKIHFVSILQSYKLKSGFELT
jgi:hypothetical protein